MLHKEFFSGQTPPTSKGEDVRSIANIEFYNEQLSRIGRKGFEYKGTRLTGDHYWYMNFCPIQLKYLNSDGIRIDELGYPLFCQTDDWLWKQVEEAEIEGKDIFLMTGRGQGKTYKVISKGLKGLFFVDNFRGVISASGDAHANTTFTMYRDSITNINSMHPTIGIDLIVDTTDKLRKGESIYSTGEDGKVQKKNKELGLMQKVIYGNRPGATKGKRLHFQHYEEIGDWSGAASLKKCIMGSKGSFRVGKLKTGIAFYTGTGGTILSTQAREIYNNPDVYNIFVPREYEKRKAIFIPSQDMYGGTYEATGIPDKELALKLIKEERELLAPDPEALSLFCQEFPTNEDEMFKLRGTNNFPQELIATQIQRILEFKDVPSPKRGTLWPNDFKDLSKGVYFKEHADGDVYVFEEPELSTDDQGKKFIYNNQYRAGIDGINEGKNDTASGEGSKFALSIKKLINPEKKLSSSTNKYVLRYLKRPNNITDAYMQTMLALIWYDCKANLEFTKTGIIPFLDKYKQTHRLLKRPKLTWADGLSEKENTLIGTIANEKNWNFILGFIRNHILESYDQIDDIEMLYQMRDFSYEDKGKFDLIASMGMTELACDGLSEIVVQQTHKEYQKVGYYIDHRGRKKYGVIPIGFVDKNKHSFAPR